MGWSDDRVLARQGDYTVREAWEIYRLKRRWGAVGPEAVQSLW